MDLISGVSVTVFLVITIAVVILILGIGVTQRYKVAGPNEAFIVTGRRGRQAIDSSAPFDAKGQKVVVGGGVFVWPFVQKRFILDLSS